MSLVSSVLPKKRTKKSTLLLYYGATSRIVFVRSLRELKTPKRHFETNWPLTNDIRFKVKLWNAAEGQEISECIF